MHFELDADQQQLQDSLRRLLDTQASFEKRRQVAAGAAGWNPAVWRAMAELGVTAMALPEEQGGFGQRPIALLPVLQELGRALSLEPFLATAVLGAAALSRGAVERHGDLFEAIASGSQVIAFAHDEPAARHLPLWIETTARRSGDGWVLEGVKQNVLHGAAADSVIVSARTHGAPDSPGGVGLYLLRRLGRGAAASQHPTRLVDDTPAATLHFTAAPAELLAEGRDVLQAVLDAGIAAVCAEALGVAERAYAMTVEYVQTRQQFGRVIGSNQALRHRVAEMRVALDMVRSAAMAGLLALEMDDADQRSRELSRAKMLVSRHGTFVAQQAIQLHGGIGMTIEYAVGHCLRRMTVLDQLFGDGAEHARRLGASFVTPA